MLSIGIGVAAVIGMVALGTGARERVVAQVRSLGTNLLVITPGNVTRSSVRLGAGAASTLTDHDAKAIVNEIAGVRVAAPFLRSTVQVIAAETNWATTLYAVDMRWFEARNWLVEDGQPFGADAGTAGQVVLLGKRVAQVLFPNRMPLGQTVRIGNVPMRVLGIMAEKGFSSFGQDQDDVIFAPMMTGRQRLIGRNMANSRAVDGILVKAYDEEILADIEDSARRLLRQRHRLSLREDDDFSIRKLADLAEAHEASARTMTFVLSVIAGISLAVGGFGIMNIMIVSVTERTQEIGLRIAVGARRRDVLRQFLFEATSLCLIGGLVGAMVGLAGALVAAERFDWPMLVEFRSVALAIAASGLVGMLFGLYPAIRACLVDPITALRHT